MSGTRPTLSVINSGTVNWDSELNDVLRSTWEAPFPMVNPTDLATLESTFPAAQYCGCTAVTEVSGTLIQFTSNGTDWVPL